MKSEAELLEALSAPFPKDAIERTRGSVTRKGYDTTGYKYQYVVDRFNVVLGLSGWKTRSSTDIIETQSKSGRTMYEATCTIQLFIGGRNPEGEFVVLAEREGIGGHTAATWADAKKGAYTNGFKKTAALFGCGAAAYRGTIDDDNLPAPEGSSNGVGVPARARAAARNGPDALRSVWLGLRPSDRQLYDELFMTLDEELKAGAR